MSFDEFAWQRTAGLVRLAWTITRNRHDAEDVAQEVLKRVFLKWNHVASRDRPDAYVYAILVNACRDVDRRSWSRREVSTDPILLPDAEVVDPAERVARHDQLVRLLDTLPVKQRTALALRYCEALDDDLIAKAMNITTETVRSHCSKGIASLRRAHIGSDAR